jgi:cell division protein FtsQ
MSIKKHIRKILFISFWCLAAAGIMVLLIAAVKSRQQKDCAGYDIEISGPADEFFIDQKDVEALLTNNGKFSIKGREIQQFDLRKMETSLKNNVWISEAELFFDNDQVLQVRVKERQPIARIFTVGGNSFYIDSAAVRLPLSDKLSARLPVFTGFPSEGIKLNRADSLLMRQIGAMSGYILRDSFSMALVAQVDIRENREMEIIPTIGKQVIEWGDATDYEKKFRRLKLFYTKVLSQTGLDYYERVKVQYSNQVVGVKHAERLSKADSIQAIKNVMALILQAQTEQERLLKMDSITVYKPRAHLRSNEQNTALTFDSTEIEKPTIPSAVPEEKDKKENPTLKSQTPYEKSQKSKVKSQK